jgi:hypothetical protein
VTVLGLVQSLRELSERWQSLQHLIRNTADRTFEIAGRLDSLHGRFDLITERLLIKRAEPTYVYLLPPTGPMSCQRAEVLPGHRVQLPFMAYDMVPPGVWVIVTGPARVRGVKVGNTMQAAMNDYHGHVCKTVDVWSIGCHLTVELEG